MTGAKYIQLQTMDAASRREGECHSPANRCQSLPRKLGQPLEVAVSLWQTSAWLR